MSYQKTKLLDSSLLYDSILHYFPFRKTISTSVSTAVSIIDTNEFSTYTIVWFSIECLLQFPDHNGIGRWIIIGSQLSVMKT